MSRDASSPWVMGIASSHNGGVCLLHGNEVVVAIQEERLLRSKRALHPAASNSLAIRYCLETAGIAPADLSLVALAVSQSNKTQSEDLSLNPALQLGRHGVPSLIIGHHMAHAVGAFATSGFTDAAVLVVDGSGSPWNDLSRDERRVVDSKQAARYADPARGPVMETVSMYMAHGVDVEPIAKHVASKDLRRKAGMARFWSLGYMYEKVANQIFGGWLEAAGKMMGLAPYGSAVVPAREFYTIVDGHFEFLDTIPNRYLHDERWPLRQTEYQDLAASTQRALEDALFVLVFQIRQLTKSRRLCYAGGVALNSVANDLLVRNGGFDDVFIMPAAEDSGTAIGAAYYGLWQLTGSNSHQRLRHDAVGRHYGISEVAHAVGQCPAVSSTQPPDLVDRTVDLLCDGKIIGWFQGRSELGPRALGQRSIVCDPRIPTMKDVLNSRVKFREEFRPFAPVVPLEHFESYFDTTFPVESPFMLRVVPFRKEVRALVPAVVHVDGTGRVQTLTKEANGRFHDLANRFYQRTGCPILLNTSLNIAGEPIVESPEDALNCLLLTGLDACVIEDWLVLKDPDYRSPLDLVPKLTIDRVQVDCRLRLGWTANAASMEAPFRVHSIHLDRARTLERWMNRSEHDLLWIVTNARWGAVLHVTNATILRVLTQIDGNRTGWQILQSLNETLTDTIQDHHLTKILGTLRRLSVIEWHDSDLLRRAPASASHLQQV